MTLADCAKCWDPPGVCECPGSAIDLARKKLKADIAEYLTIGERDFEAGVQEFGNNVYAASEFAALIEPSDGDFEQWLKKKLDGL